MRAALFLILSTCLCALPAQSYQNLLQDPGFERYHYDPALGCYVPDADAAWTEYAGGRASVVFDGSSWSAPRGMTDQQPLGFSPGTTGFEGWGATENTGMMYFVQDLTNLSVLQSAGTYEAWIWLGGAGADDDVSDDLKKEEGGWEIFFYTNNDPSTWTEDNAIEYHHERFDFWGKPNTFVQISGIGVFPSIVNGARFRVHATTFGFGFPPQNDYGTKVVVDNAYFGPANRNLLLNGGFEQDRTAAEFRFWDFPDPWWPQPGTVIPADIDGYGENFDHGSYRPYFGWRWAYGYGAYFHGWVDDAYSFGQEVDFDVPTGAEMALSFYWVMATKEDQADLDLRRPMAWAELGVDYKTGEMLLETETYRVDWPLPPDLANTCRRDYNTRRAHNPTIHLWPPDGTTRIGVHVRIVLNCWPPGTELFNVCVDDFNLRVLQTPKRNPALFELR